MSGITYHSLLQEYLVDLEDRDYCRFLKAESDRPLLYIAWLCSLDRVFIMRAHEALDDLRWRIFRYNDEEADPDRYGAREALGTWVTTFMHMINPHFSIQQVWGGNGERDDWGDYVFGDRQLKVFDAAPEPLRSELLRMAAECDRWWEISREERASTAVWTEEDD